MKKFLSVLALMGMVAITGNQCANAAFSWNPANWFGHGCNKCETPKKDCGCPKKVSPCPCTTGAAAPCDPCQKTAEPQPCDACDRLQNSIQHR